MNRALPSILLVALAWVGEYQTTPHTLRVLTYNIHHGEGTDGQFDLARLAGVIQSVDPDLVALQEVDQGTQRAGGVNQLTELGRLTGMYAEFGKAMDFSGGGYGVAVLSREPLIGVRAHPLPGSADREPRTALTVHVPLSRLGPLLEFTSTHLDQGRETGNRVAQAAYLNQLLVRGDGHPSILAGDLNSRADSEVLQILDAQWTNASAVAAPTDQTQRPQSGVDYVLVRPGERWHIVESRVVDAPIASDHRPVLLVR